MIPWSGRRSRCSGRRVATAFVVGFAGLMLDGSKLGVGVFMGCVAVLYFVIVSALLLTILLALRVVEVGTYRFAYPGVDEVRHLGEVPLIVAKRERAGTVLRCFERNHAVVNGKANYLIGAQVWFRNAMVLLFLLATLLAGRAVLGNGPAPGTSTLRGRGAIPAPTEEGPGPQQPPCPADRRGALAPQLARDPHRAAEKLSNRSPEYSSQEELTTTYQECAYREVLRPFIGGQRFKSSSTLGEECVEVNDR